MSDVVILGSGRGSAELIDLLDQSALHPVAVLDDVESPTGLVGVPPQVGVICGGRGLCGRRQSGSANQDGQELRNRHVISQVQLL